MAPDVSQSSYKDAGVASLKAMLQGFGISINQTRLSEALHIKAETTSIDILEEAANQLGLKAEQVIVPPEFILLTPTKMLPAIVVVRQTNGRTHFVVAWNRLGSFIQMMDPAFGRKWLSSQQFLDKLYNHIMPVSAKQWRAWAASEEFQIPLHQRLLNLKLSETDIAYFIETALADPNWYSLAALDAAIRMLEATIRAGGLDAGEAATEMLTNLFQQGQNIRDTSFWLPRAATKNIIPPAYWFAQPLAPHPPHSDDEEQLLLHGAVLVRILGQQEISTTPSETEDEVETISPELQATRDEAETISPELQAARKEAKTISSELQATRDEAETISPELQAAPKEAETISPELQAARKEAKTISSELQAARKEKTVQTDRKLWETLRADGLFTPSIVLAALVLAGAGITIEALLLRGLTDIGQSLTQVEERIGVLVILLAFFVAFILLQMSISATAIRIGRRLETRLRIALLEKIPRLGDQYFQNQPISNLTQRAHNLRQIRRLPNIGTRFLELTFQFLFTAGGIIWLDPPSALIVILIIVANFGLLSSFGPTIIPPNFRLRLHSNDLGRFYLDALLGLVPIRTHGAEQSPQRQHDSKLVEWMRAGWKYFRVVTSVQSSGGFAFAALTVWLLFNYITRGGEIENLLLLTYWILSLPELLTQVSVAAVQYPNMHNIARMLFEPLTAPEEMEDEESQADQTQLSAAQSSSAAAISVKNVTVKIGQQTLLKELTFDIEPGKHVGIVGPSGAGKSTLVGLLLGWLRPTSGQLLIDGQPLNRARLQALRRETIWVDPAIQIWNHSFLHNLSYGTSSPDLSPLGYIIEQADLLAVLKKFPDGLQTPLGEAGGLVSGGEGQRVRLGRAMFRQGGRLVILDEPFRGLDRDKRNELLRRARRYWADATLICITHDVGQVQTFERVLLVENGQIVEDDTPHVLAAKPDSRYKALLEAEEAVREGLWSTTEWRRLWLAEGRVNDRAENGNTKDGQ